MTLLHATGPPRHDLHFPLPTRDGKLLTGPTNGFRKTAESHL
jgi:hypothetical protein